MGVAELRFALRVLVPRRNVACYMRSAVRALIRSDIATLRALEAA